MIRLALQRLLTGFALAAAVFVVDDLDAQVRVRGYTKKDGTYVAPHYRSSPNGNFSDNWSTKGNVNPYTGKPGTRVTPPAGYGRSTFRAFASAPVPEARADFLDRAAGPAPDLRDDKVADEAPIFVEPEKTGSYSSGSSGAMTPSTPQELRAARMAMWRERSEAKRRHTWANLPTKDYTEEDLAECKLQAARLLIQNGRIEAGQKWLNQVVILYPKTTSAVTAREMLEPLALVSAK